MIRTISLTLLLLFCASLASAQDLQVRFLAHTQLVHASNDAGLALWGIVPDITQTDPAKVLILGGPFKKTNLGWFEFMTGGFLDERGDFDPVLNFRTNLRKKKAVVYGEIMHTFPRKRLLLSGALTWFGLGRLGIGLESDTQLKPINSSSGLGPRIVLPIKRVNLITAY